MKKKTVYLIILVLMICVIFAFSNQSADISYNVSSSITQDFNNLVNNVVELDAWAKLRTFIWKNNRKIAHLILFACFGWCAIQYFAISLHLKRFLKYAISLLFCTAIALLDEFHQSFVPGRGSSLMDVCIDTIGIMIGLVLYFFFTLVGGKLKQNERKKDGSSV